CAPDRSPEQERDGDRQRIDFQAASQQLRIEHIQREKMQADHANHHHHQVSGLQLSQSDQDRRNHGQHYTQVRNQAQKAAEKSDEVEERNVQQPENRHARARNQESDQQVPHNEALQHFPDQPER